MTGHLLSPAAQADPAEIWSYSFEDWGAAQADRYVNGIRDACAELTGNPTRGRAVDDIGRDTESWPSVRTSSSIASQTRV
jgi:toxin ParE1/3/4